MVLCPICSLKLYKISAGIGKIPSELSQRINRKTSVFLPLLKNKLEQLNLISDINMLNYNIPSKVNQPKINTVNGLKLN